MISENLDKALRNVQKPGRYVGGEWNAVIKDPERVQSKIALVFPDLYEIGMSHIGQKILYSLLNRSPSVLAERVFAPWPDFEKELKDRNIPLFSLENRIPLSEFDILGFSLLYELNYSNILSILDLGKIPLLSKERGLDTPLVIAGGPAVFNPEPVADLFDLFLVGDGEEAIFEILDTFLQMKRQSESKGKIEGVYVPSLYSAYYPSRSSLMAVTPEHGAPARIKKRVLSSFSAAHFPKNVVVPNIQVVFDRVSVEVERGCPQSCRFCQATQLYFPSRVKNPTDVAQTVLDCVQDTGYEDASLSALSIGDYPYLDQAAQVLMDEFQDRKISLSVSSLRPKGLSSELAENILRVRKTGFTLVPEAGTERLRRVINKSLNDEDIWEAVRNAFARGWRHLKLYFMVGLPSEREEDLDGIVALVREIIRLGYGILKKPPQINLSISSFIPKAHTPFQWENMEEEDVLIQKYSYVKSRLKKYPFIKFKEHNLKNALLEAVFSRGDRRLNSVIVEAWKRGARFDSWSDLFRFQYWEDAFQACDINYHGYLGGLKEGDILPWDHIDTGIKKSHLISELAKARQEEFSPNCMDKSCAECRGCSLASLLIRDAEAQIEPLETKFPAFGKKSGSPSRYLAFYSKSDKAKYFSHSDLNNIIQRGFRRAGIPVCYTQGFHPKMIVSYPPALPLGMEGRAEVIEFRSDACLPQDEFADRLNSFLPSGVRFLHLEGVDWNDPPLIERIQRILYSLDLSADEVLDRLEISQKDTKRRPFDGVGIVEGLVERHMRENENASKVDFRVDQDSQKLILDVAFDPKKLIRPQDIVSELFEIANPVYDMAREKIVFKTS
ncbi:MAG: TIGR03960 family B12-binding radical SAM protein [Candidatus Aminicenantes bacterium]|jgi:radical SAM family uncharacterized protein/radical SAM-linked protein